MQAAIRDGLSHTGTLPGGLGVERKAQHLYNQRHIDEREVTRENRIVCSYAYAVVRGEKCRLYHRHTLAAGE